MFFFCCYYIVLTFFTVHINSVAPQHEVTSLWHTQEIKSKCWQTFLQGMKFFNIGRNLRTSLFHAYIQ
jgi:hypothetical protein